MSLILKFQLAFLVILFSSSVLAEPMNFRLIPPNEPAKVFGNSWKIFADGVLDEEAAGRLESLLKKYNVPARSTIYLNSPGGSLIGGVSLGKVIRKNGLNTDVSKYQNDSIEELYGGKYRFHHLAQLSGQCMSACIYVYVGGVFRFLSKDSNLGVHQFYSTKNNLGSNITQLTSAYLLQYLREMGIDEALYSEMAAADKDQINILSRPLAQQLNVVNEGDEKPKWSIESVDKIMYVKGERQTWRGMNKFIVACDSTSRQISTLFMFDAEGRADEILTMRALSIFLNSTAYPINTYIVGQPLIQDRLMMVEFKLPMKLIQRILSSNSVGIAFQFVEGAPIFAGFEGLDLKDGQSKIKSLISLCQKG